MLICQILCLNFDVLFTELCSSRKKLRNRGLFSSLFCCFGGRGDPASAFVNASINSPDEAPNHNQNTIAKGYEPDIEEENSNEEQVCHCFEIDYLSLYFVFSYNSMFTHPQEFVKHMHFLLLLLDSMEMHL